MNFVLSASTNHVLQYILGSLLIFLSVGLIALILQQTGKEKGLSVISGSSETYFGKSGGNKKDRILSTLTIIGSALFVVITVILVILIKVGTAVD